MSEIRLSVIILTWNERDELEECLKSLIPWIEQTLDEVLVIDNGSCDSTIDMVRRQFPEVKYFYLPKNIGIGPARNYGVSRAMGRYVMTLDNDTRFLGPSPGPVIDEFFGITPHVGVIGFRLENEDGSLQRSARRFPTLYQPFVARISWLRTSKFGRLLEQHHHMLDVPLDKMTESVSVDYLLGANQIFLKERFLELGGYDENMFYGAEDCDLCVRAKKGGLTNYFLPAVKIRHVHKRRSRRSMKLWWHHTLSFYRMFYKQRKLKRLYP